MSATAHLLSITCPQCGATSNHPVDVREGYCGACHAWTTPRPFLRPVVGGGPAKGGQDMTVYFGEAWDAPILDGPDVQRVPTPVGDCYLCDEPIEPDDRGFVRPAITLAAEPVRLRPVHRECELRSVLGGLDHVLGRCEYTGHCNELRQASGRSLREDALAVWEWAHGERERA